MPVPHARARIALPLVLGALAAALVLPVPGAASAAPPSDRVDLTAPPVRDLALPARPWLAGHRGLDLPARPGDPVRSPRAGTVRFAGTVAGVPVVVVVHGPLRATYQPVTTTRAVGTRVRAGQVFATVAPDGGHCAGRCLHWGLRVQGTSPPSYLDPRLLLGDVRLLP